MNDVFREAHPQMTGKHAQMPVHAVDENGIESLCKSTAVSQLTTADRAHVDCEKCLQLLG